MEQSGGVWVQWRCSWIWTGRQGTKFLMLRSTVWLYWNDMQVYDKCCSFFEIWAQDFGGGFVEVLRGSWQGLILIIQDSFGQTGQTIHHSTATQRILHACHEVFPACHASLRAWCGIRGCVKRYGQRCWECGLWVFWPEQAYIWSKYVSGPRSTGLKSKVSTIVCWRAQQVRFARASPQHVAQASNIFSFFALWQKSWVAANEAITSFKRTRGLRAKQKWNHGKCRVISFTKPFER